MDSFVVTISELAHVDGITAARQAYNARRSADDPIMATNGEYVQFVMARAAESYAKQYGTVNT